MLISYEVNPIFTVGEPEADDVLVWARNTGCDSGMAEIVAGIPQNPNPQGGGEPTSSSRIQKLTPCPSQTPSRCVAFTFQISLEHFISCAQLITARRRIPSRSQVTGRPRKRYGDKLTEEFTPESPWIDGVVSSASTINEPFPTLEGTAAPA